MKLVARWRRWAEKLEHETDVLILAYRDPETPRAARLLLVLVVGYSLSPIDLIPDFIPVLGYLDDLVLVPLGIWAARRLIPDDVLARCRQQALTQPTQAAVAGRLVALFIILIWLSGLAWLVASLLSTLRAG